MLSLPTATAARRPMAPQPQAAPLPPRPHARASDPAFSIVGRFLCSQLTAPKCGKAFVCFRKIQGKSVEFLKHVNIMSLTSKHFGRVHPYFH
jgi:hypothetical protein